MNLLQNEWVKFSNLKLYLLTILLTILLNLGNCLIMEHNDMSTWKDDALVMLETYKASLEESTLAGVPEEYCNTFSEEISIIDYSLNNNIPYKVLTAIRHTLSMANVLPFLLIIIIFSCSKVFIKEYECNTWKNLLCTGISPNKLFNSKILYIFVHSFYLIASYFLVCVFIGLIIYGNNDNIIGLQYVNGDIVEFNQFSELLKTYGIFIAKALFCCMLTVLCVLLTKGKVSSLIIPIAFYFMASYINGFLGDNIGRFLPFKYMSANSYSQFSDGAELLFGIFIPVIYIVLMYVAASFMFKLLFRNREVQIKGI